MVTLSDLFKMKESEINLEEGVTFKVRGINRGELDDITDTSKNDNKAYARWVVKQGVTDPQMTEQDVKRLPAGWPDRLFNEIMRLSGFEDESKKEKSENL